MRRYLKLLGRPKLVVLITIIAIFMAVLLTSLIGYFLHTPIDSDNILRALIIPIIIAPLISWYLVGLFFKLDKLEGKLHHLVNFDELTGLMSRRAFLDGAKKAISFAQRHNQPTALLALDLDHFKTINDKYGHLAGDTVLASFGQLINETIRQSDFAGRVGGEEFCFILPNTNLEQARIFATKIHSCMAKAQFKFKDNQIHYTASIGISVQNKEQSKTLEQLMYQADLALYKAKDNGRNQTLCFEGS